jgi:1-acyl-sn-glycerol-3-phosphate acyltransferase
MLRRLFISLVARPLARVFTGVDVAGREHLPVDGPAIVAANHTSHVDTLLMLAIFPGRTVIKVRPAAAADYFLATPLSSWFSRKIIGIVPVARDKVREGEDILAPAREALARGEIVVVFPEGTRGADPDAMGRLKNGVARLAEAFPEAPVIPVWIQGAGRVLPKGAKIPVPMNCWVGAGPALHWEGRRTAFMDTLRDRLLALKAEAPPLRWS